VPEREPDVRARPLRQSVAAKDAEDARRMPECRDLCQQARLDVLTRDEQLDGLDPRGQRRLDEILPFGDEEPELVAPAAVVQLADELELFVVSGADQDC
jgi:hypothetical protein